MKYIHIILSSLFVLNVYAGTIEKIVEGAYNEVANNTAYNTDMLDTYVPPTYRDGKNVGKSVYPNGDVNPKEGVCADLVVRALRNAGLDLQKSVHMDVVSNKKRYGVNTPDKYIDQRRVWILNTYFKRNWQTLTTRLNDPKDWRPGDVIVWDIGSKNHLHIGIAGKEKRPDGFPHVIHNMRYIPLTFAGKTIEQDVLEGPKLFGNTLQEWKIIGHYRAR